MPMIIACAASLGVLAALVLFGVMDLAELAHPFWKTRASLTGGAIGAVFAAGLIWWVQGERGNAGRLSMILALLLSIAIAVTWRAAQVFINSSDYEPVAGQLWFLGYHVLCALLVAGIALAITAWPRR